MEGVGGRAGASSGGFKENVELVGRGKGRSY